MPTPADQLPTNISTLARKIADLEREVRELRASRRLASAAIDGGALTVRDAASGRQVVLTPNGGADGTLPALRFYSGATNETRPGEMSVNIREESPGVVSPYIAIDSPTTDTGSDIGSQLKLYSGIEDSTRDGKFQLAGFVEGGAGVVIDGEAYDGTGLKSQASMYVYDPATDQSCQLTVTPDGFEVSPGTGRDLAYANGVLTTGNIARGTVTVTPSAANTPTPFNISGFFLNGTVFRGKVTANTTVPAPGPTSNGVNNVSISSVTSTSATIWVNRQNTTATVVYWEITGDNE